jgi:hypothetical protein
MDNNFISTIMEVIMFYSILFSFLPTPMKIGFLGKNFWTTYTQFYLSTERKAISYHRRKLCEMDLNFKMEEAGKELVRRRQLALEQGIDPLSSKYPDISDVLGLKKEKTH